MTKNMQKIVLSITASILAAGGAQAYELNLGTNLPPVDFHGFASQGFLASSKYNYLGDSSRGSFRYTEAGINASFNPFDRTRVTAQGFLFDAGNAGEYHPFLDYASIEYTFNDKIGLRAGRIRKPSGIYNDIQDIDLARTFVLLPQGIYDARFRDLSCSLDGAEAFGDVPLSKAGSLGYAVYFGYAHAASDSGLAKLIDNSLAPGGITSFDDLPEVGYQLWWNTPVDGLRLGASFCDVINFNYDFNEPTGFPPPNNSLPLRAEAEIPIQTYSAEYVWKNWTFQAEYYHLSVSQDTMSPFGKSHSYSFDDAWYADASYRFNKWLEVGGYYTEDYSNGTAASNTSDGAQKDAALSFRFDPTSWWVFKVEGHYIRGTALLDDNASNPTRNNDGWFMLAVKTTFSF
jgi:hypothetical protein